jgi:hypothetical protein
MAFLAGGMFAEALRQLVPRRDPEAVAKRAE